MISYQEANRISIKAYLQSLHIHPAKERDYYGMYHSPFRDDCNASMKVDYHRNLWIDYGTGEGGTAIDLVMRVENCSFQIAISILECMHDHSNVGMHDCLSVSTHDHPYTKTCEHLTNHTADTFFFHRDKTFATAATPREPAITIRKITAITHPALLDYLKERNIAEGIAKEHCVEVHYTVNDNPYYAIGFENDSGGYELRSRYFKGCTTKDISSKTGNVQSATCYLFEGFMDYLSFLTIQKNRHQEHTSVQLHNDVIVLNSLANLSKARNTLAGYQSIAAFLDNDEAGQKAVRELKSTYKNVDDRSLSYKGFKDLNEYFCGKTMEQPVKKKSRGLKL